MFKNPSPKTLGFFNLVMINIIAVDSLRSLPISAEYGFSLLFFYLLSVVIFFVPSILITAELATSYPNTGGIYVWVREAFGPKMGFLVIWFQWVYNIVWYPTIMAFIAASIAYFFNPALGGNKWYLIITTVSLFWLVTFINVLGMRLSSWVSTVGAIFGTLVPMILVISLGFIWVLKGYPLQTTFSFGAFFPHITDIKNIAFLSAVIFGLVGMEMSAVHAGEVRDPERAYPKALLVSGTIIFLSLVLASLAIAVVVPHSQLNLITGLLQAFSMLFSFYHLKWLMPIIVAMIIVGSLSGVVAWVIGPSKGLLVAARDGCLPSCFTRVNRYGVPVPVLLLQGAIFTVLCSVFVLIPTVSGSYWLLSAMTAQLGLLVYVLLFASAIRLRYTKPHLERRFTIPGGKTGLFCATTLGIVGSIFAILVGFLPPEEAQIGGVFYYELILITSIVLFSIAPLFLYRFFSKQ